MAFVIPVGTSEPADFQLSNNGVALDGTGLTIDLVMDDGSPAVIDPPLTVSWISAESGTVRVQGTEVMPIGSYLVRFKLTDGAGDVGFVPNLRAALRWDVVPLLDV